MKRILMTTVGALSLFLAVPALAQGNYPAPNGDRTDANGMPTTHSTPGEQAQTADLNAQVQANNQAADAKSDANNAQYQQSQQQYQSQIQQNQEAQDQYQGDRARYQRQAMHYEDLRARYGAETAAYHRGVWPDRYVHWELADYYPGIVGQRVEIVNGDRVGTVTDVARSPSGRVDALMVELDRGKTVWIDTSDIRYDRADGIVMTNLDRMDLHQMADARL